MADYRRVAFLSVINFCLIWQNCAGQAYEGNNDQIRQKMADPGNRMGMKNRPDTQKLQQFSNQRLAAANIVGAGRLGEDGIPRGIQGNQMQQNVMKGMTNDRLKKNFGGRANKNYKPVNPLGQIGGPKPIRAGAGSTLKLAEHPDCQQDVESMCSKKMRNNFQVLDCLQSDKEGESRVSLKCQHLVYSYKRNLTQDMRFDSAASQVCKQDMDQLTECNSLPEGQGVRISCLIENKDLLQTASCKQFVAKMSAIVFGDYRLLANFQEECSKDIEALGCGRIGNNGPKAIHSQGPVIECLSAQVTKLQEDCKHEILRVAELQSDDYHEDRALFYACRDDRETFCAHEVAGNGKVYSCLYKHKFDRGLSTECRKQLTRRQGLMSEDVRVNRGLVETCQKAIANYDCVDPNVQQTEEAKQATIIKCLEDAMREGKTVESECQLQLKQTRKSLMEDYKANPKLAKACKDEIDDYCKKGSERGGKTMHCLMNEVKTNPDHISEGCKKELGVVIERVEPGDSLSLDPVLNAACAPVAAKLCAGIKDEDGEVISCLMENLNSHDMTDLCKDKLMEVEYFVARDFKLDRPLYKACKTDAKEQCSDVSFTYRSSFSEDEIETKMWTFACLHSLAKERKLTRQCQFEVRRVMRQRAVSVELNPRIQEPCLNDLATFCQDKSKTGEEMLCLQKNYKELEPKCQSAIGNFTQEQDKDVRMDTLIMKSCTPMIKKFCTGALRSFLSRQKVETQLDDKSTEPGQVMECLIKHKTDQEMDQKCQAAIEHHQLLSLSDYRFSYKFKEACKEDVKSLCKKGVKSKNEVVTCLSEKVRDDTINEQPHRVSQPCRVELTFQLLQRSESIKLDPMLLESCRFDMNAHCQGITPGSAAVLECLKKHEPKLQKQCKDVIFKREEVEVVNVKGDFYLQKQCQRMIKTYCPDAQADRVFTCLREHKMEHDFDETCKKALIERMREKSKDYRLNVELMTACKLDIPKFCQREADNLKLSGTELEGTVMECLRIKFAQKRLSESCAAHVSTKVEESALDFKQDPVLARGCHEEINMYCQDKVVAKDLDDHGQVEECLKLKMNKGIIKNEACLKALARNLAENKADVHTDPILYKACATDLQHYCQGVPRGEGRQMSCLLSGLDDTKVSFQPGCTKMLQERREMWEMAAEQAPPETMNEMLNLLVVSPSRNYLVSMIFVFIFFIFFFGICCGRVSKRIRREIKNR